MASLKELAAMTALNEMMRKGHFSICTIDTVSKMLDVDPRGEAYDLLRTLHCMTSPRCRRICVSRCQH